MRSVFRGGGVSLLTNLLEVLRLYAVASGAAVAACKVAAGD